MRNIILRCLVVASLAIPCAIAQGNPYVQEVLQDTPSVYLQFDDLKADQPKKTEDSTGKHHAEVAGKVVASKGVPGIGGQAATFDGRTSLLTIPAAGSLKLNALSVEFWFRSTQPFEHIFWPGSATLVSKATPGAASSDWTINAASSKAGDNQGRLLAETGPADAGGDLFLYSPLGKKLNDGRWHHVVWTRTQQGESTLYLDGKLASRGHDGGGSISNERAIQLGGDPIHGNDRHFAGQIDEVAIYNKPLSPQRVGAHFTAAVRGTIPPAAERRVDFVKDVQPIFRRRCFECHGPGESEGGLSLANRARALQGGDGGKIIVSGSGVASRLVHLIASSDEEQRMPSEDDALSRTEIGLIRAWIDQGAKWPKTADLVDPKTEKALRHWAFQPIHSPKIPQVTADAWVANPIDAFVLKRLEAAGLKPAPRAHRAMLLRRAQFDVIGLPPSPDDVEAFLQAKDGKGAYKKLVERLLASPHYGERWGRHWLDVARYADSAGFEVDSYFDHAWRYRDYVIRSLNDDKPFDRFIHEQLAGDELWPNDEASQWATGFLTVGPFRYEGGIKRPEVVQYERLTDLADTTGTAFLGLTVGCARCHTHKYDPISQKDYFGMQAIFAPSQLWDSGRNKAPDNSNDRKKPQKWIVRNRKSPPIVHVLRRGNLESPGPVAVPALLRSLPGGRSLADSETNSFLNRRSQLARWLTAKENPLTARVIANRVWQWHFGRSLVPTPDDFGLQGEPPTHPELLDYLAAELINNGWKVKHLHRLIMASSTYQMTSLTGDEAMAKDPGNRWLTRFPRRRMEAEIIWDNLHATSGALNREQFGPPVFPPIDKSVLGAILNTSWEVTKDKGQWSRRGIYMVVRRSIRIPFFDDFNAAEPATSCVRRDTTVVSPQALTLLNGEVASQQARLFAGRLLREGGVEHGKIVERAWLIAYGRRVDKAELERSTAFLKLRASALAEQKPDTLARPLAAPPGVGEPAFRAALVEFCLALLNTNEFIYID